MAKIQIQLRSAVFISICVGIAFLIIGILMSNRLVAYYQKLTQKQLGGTSVTVPTSTPSPQSTSNVNSDIDTYEKIAAQAIQASNRTLDLMTWIVTTSVPIIVLIASAFLSYITKLQKDNLDYSNSIMKELNDVGQKLIVAEKQSSNISSNYMYLLNELNHQSIVFLPPEMAISAFDQGKITKDEFRESQIWLSWVKWFYIDKEEGFLELEIYKDSIQSLPHSIRRIMIVEIERIKEAVKKRGMIYKKEDELLKKLLFLLDLETVDKIVSTLIQ